MKKIFLTATVLLISFFTVFTFGAYAQGNSFLYVHQSDGGVSSISIDNLQKITFTDEDIIIQQVDDVTSSFPYAAVLKLTFEGSDTGFNSVVEKGDGIYYNPQSESVIFSSNAPLGDVRVYNLQGVLLVHTVVRSLTGDISLSSFPAGLYIVKAGASVKKIVKN